jgi:hypothetical protein
VLHDERVCKGEPGAFDVWSRRGPRGRAVITDEGTGDSEHDIALEVAIVVDEHLSDQGLEARFEAEEMKVGRPVGMAFLGAEQFAHGTIGRHTIGTRLDRAK